MAPVTIASIIRQKPTSNNTISETINNTKKTSHKSYEVPGTNKDISNHSTHDVANYYYLNIIIIHPVNHSSRQHLVRSTPARCLRE